MRARREMSASGASLAREAEDERIALSSAATQRGGPEGDAATAHLVHERDRHAGPRRAERVPECDRVAVDVHDLLVRSEHPGGVQRDGCEGLVYLQQADV